MSFCYSCCGVIWSVLTRPLLGLLYAFLSLNYSDPVLSLGLHSCYFGLSRPILLLMGFLGPFLPPWAFSTHSNSTFPCAFTNSFELPRSNYHILYFWSSWAFSSIPYSLTSLFQTFFGPFLLSISHNTHGFTTSFFGLLYARLLPMRPISYFLGLWSIIPAIRA